MWQRKNGRLRLRLVAILFIISKEIVISHIYSIKVNQNVKIPQTTCAIVPCTFVADSRKEFLNSTGHWRPDLYSTVASTDKSEGTNQNFHAIGDPNKGDCTLKITNARKADEGSYFFRFEESKQSQIQYNYKDTQVKVQVTDIREIDGYSIQVNQTVTVQKGLCVTIPCTFIAYHKKSFTTTKGHWKTICHEFVASSDKSIVVTKPNFQLMGNPDNGDCTLMITDAKEQDSGKYYFRFEDGHSGLMYSYVTAMITIQVTDLIEKPVISDPGILTEGKKVTLTCKAPRGCNNTIITWQNRTGILNNSTDLTFVPTRSDHQTLLTCQMTFSSLKIYTQNEITLYVQYPPSIFITIETPEIQNYSSTGSTTYQEVTVQEGSSLALKCSVDSNPEAQVTWMKGENNVLNKNNGNELMLYLSNITATEADKYHCLVQNKIWVVNKTINIILQSDNTKNLVIAGISGIAGIAGIAGGVGIAVLLLVAVTVKLLLSSRTKNTEETNKTKDLSSTAKQHKPDYLYGNTECGINAKVVKEKQSSTEIYVNLEEGPIASEEESVYETGT